MIENYNTIIGEFSDVTVIERSKFICYLKGIEDEEQAKSFIINIKKQNSLANHNCYAYIADDKGLVMKFSDDGEPQGTAGLPMLEVLKNKRLYKTVAVVTRYFGGIKLGAGGLVRAYSGAVSDCVKEAQVFEMSKVVFLHLLTDYEGYSKLDNLLVKMNIPKVEVNFENEVKLKVVIKTEDGAEENFCNKILDLFKGKDIVKNKEYGYYAFKV